MPKGKGQKDKQYDQQNTTRKTIDLVTLTLLSPFSFGNCFYLCYDFRILIIFSKE